MRLTGWAIALAAAGLTPVAAGAQAGSSTQNAPAAAAATPPAGTAQNPGKPDTAQPPTVVPGSIGHMLPTAGIGEPDGRKGIQEQVTPIG